jgi:hypothetical protein
MTDRYVLQDLGENVVRHYAPIMVKEVIIEG